MISAWGGEKFIIIQQSFGVCWEEGGWELVAFRVNGNEECYELRDGGKFIEDRELLII